MLTRRAFTASAVAFGLSACAKPPAAPTTRAATTPPKAPPLPPFYGAITDEPYPIPAIVDATLPPKHWRQTVPNPWPKEPSGTIIVDPDAGNLHVVQDSDIALRYGVSVGAEGFAWAGVARLQFCRDWPRWKVPAAMIARQPDLARFSVANGGMDPGPDNPMGARALYLFQDGVDTLYRIHGGAEARDIGRAVSSGCIRLLDQDVIDLHDRAIHGSKVIVLTSLAPQGLGTVF
ncbi:L,D-transpeptidase [Roseibaca sp. V10]|uniref:L,D-transpeptidase n=1 Tax=Roseinatronobacter domitianus TaxID=2940293 RepID=A0ABT0M2S0_9RHOB|nr:L,D-transpeptidase [Roseibaca domitiana]MCL1629141.1 L,D-transpeptidase [Roseibaca domitiana]